MLHYELFSSFIHLFQTYENMSFKYVVLNSTISTMHREQLNVPKMLLEVVNSPSGPDTLWPFLCKGKKTNTILQHYSKKIIQKKMLIILSAGQLIY